MRVFLYVFISLFLLGANPVKAEEPYNYLTINGLDGKPFFFINIANNGNSVSYDGKTYTSKFTLNDEQVNAIRKGMEYWVTVLDKYKNTSLIPEISLFADPDTDLNAFAESADSSFDTGKTQFGDMITGKGDYDEPTALIGIYNYPSWGTGDMSSLPQNGDEPNLSVVMLHELGHALGIAAAGSSEDANAKLLDTLNLWTQGLRNKNGGAPVAGQVISVFLPKAGKGTNEGLYFTGTEVGEVLCGVSFRNTAAFNNNFKM